MNIGPDHLSRLESGEDSASLEDNLPNAQLFLVQIAHDHLNDIIDFLTIGTMPVEHNAKKNKQSMVRSVDFTMIAGKLYKLGPR